MPARSIPSACADLRLRVLQAVFFVRQDAYARRTLAAARQHRGSRGEAVRLDAECARARGSWSRRRAPRREPTLRASRCRRRPRPNLRARSPPSTSEKIPRCTSCRRICSFVHPRTAFDAPFGGLCESTARHHATVAQNPLDRGDGPLFPLVVTRRSIRRAGSGGDAAGRRSASLDSPVVAVVGLGYVGLPLVVEFGKRFRTIGFDIHVDKVDKCRRGIDPSREVAASEMRLAIACRVHQRPGRCWARPTSSWSRFPTPVDERTSRTSPAARRQRDHRAAPEARCDRRLRIDRLPGRHRGSLHPGARGTSGLDWKQDFFVGYSPERINPGDRSTR